jgi:alanine racemase
MLDKQFIDLPIDARARPTWLEVQRPALIHNIRQVRSLLRPGCRLMGVTKANAYGHGATAVAETYVQAGVDYLAVASLSEALELRSAGIRAPILVLGYTPGWLAAAAVQARVTLTVYDLACAHAYAAAAAALSATLTVHVKVNTGMNRLGVLPADATALVAALRGLPALQVEGIFTHFATSDELEKSFAEEQFARFTSVLASLNAAGLRPPLAHAANSAAMLTMPATHLEMVRSGIALLGLHPDDEQCPLPASFRPALQWKALVAQVMQLQPGDTVSYGREFTITRPTVAAVIPVGYADGFPRKPRHWGSVLIHGQAAPILGRVCMDQTIVDVSTQVAQGSTVRQGDEVVLIGQQAGITVTAEEVARRLGTNNYDVVSRILGRVPRIMIE